MLALLWLAHGAAHLLSAWHHAGLGPATPAILLHLAVAHGLHLCGCYLLAIEVGGLGM